MNNSQPDQDLVNWLSQYFAQRGGFLAQVIRADLQTLPLYRQNGLVQNGQSGHSKNGQNGQALPKPDSDSSIATPAVALALAEVARSTRNLHDIGNILIDLVAEQTGYPKQSITLEARLLDDLNLDSIKAGELVAAAAKTCGLAGQLDPTTLSNVTLKEVAEAIYAALPALDTAATPVISAAQTITAPQTNTVSQMLLKLVEERTGFPQATLSLDMRLLDDLNLDSIKAADLIATAAKQLGVGGELDPSVLANATLADVVTELEAAQPIATTKTLTAPNPKIPAASWVRNFAIDSVTEAVPSRTATDWMQAQVRLVADALDSPVAAALAQHLCILGAKVEKLTYLEFLSKTEPENSSFSHFIAVLPQPADSSSVDSSSADSSKLSTFPLEQMIARLRSIGTPATTQANPYVMYVQFGGGNFGGGVESLASPEALSLDTLSPDAPAPESCCAAAFARSLHLERPALRVRVVDLACQIAPNRAAELVVAELAGTEPIVTAGYDAQQVRRVPQARLQQPVDYLHRSIAWSATDVVLVTGGAKGITAECALAIAKSTGVKMALVGRSAVPTSGDGKIAQTLERFRSQGLTVRYYACDIANPDAVGQLVTTVTDELGTITGIIHGAGLNTPRRLEQVSLEAAQTEVSPKLLGAHNLLQALVTTPPKLFIAFSSIIGVTGMAGNTWYGFTNEALNLLLRRFASQHPETSVLSLAYSVWAEVGMGARMGSVKNLERMGIGAISNQEGVDRCLKLFQFDPGVKQVVIAARLGGLDTWSPVPLPPPTDLRFIEQVRQLEPGVELTVRTHLSLERDLYVKDHIWRGSYLFPTVFGLEAMAQAAAYVTGEAQPTIVRIETISLRRPIVVNPTTGVDIEIHAEVGETNATRERSIKVGIRTEQTGFSTDHFSAVLVLGQRQPSPQLSPEQMPPDLDRPLAIHPKVDLYGSLLFQGALFQQINAIFSLSRERSLLQSHAHTAADLKETGFPIAQGSNLLLGDPYFRDVLLQCMQLNIPQDICLPVQIDRIDLFENPALASGKRIITAILNQRVEQEYICEVIATDAEGTVLEHLQGYRLRVLEEHPENPTALELAAPEQRDQAALQQALATACTQLNLSQPAVELGYVPGLGSQPKKQRRAAEQPIVARLLQRYQKADPVEFTLKTLSSGKPQLSGATVAGLDVSLSHDDRYCLCSVAETPQGCDIEAIEHRSPEDWVALLSTARTAIVNQLVQEGDARDRAGTRIWSALEAVRKAFNGIDPEFSVAGQQGAAILLQAKATDAIHFVLTVPVQLTRYPERMVALVVEQSSIQSHANVQSYTEEGIDPYGLIRPNEHRARVTADGPQEQPVYEKRFPVTFKEGCGISRKVTVSQYISWVGKIRELPMRSMSANMVPDFLSGEWGMVTNAVSLRILGEATTYDTIQARCWLGNLINSSFDTYIEFCKVLPDETLERVALAEVKATWVRLLSYGIPFPQPFPEYLQVYLDRFTSKAPAAIDLKNAPTLTLSPLPTSLAGLDSGSVHYQSQHRYGDLLLSEVFQTTLEESNLVGNVYYGNYFIWQGRTLDLFLYSIAPEYMRVSTAQGEMISVYSHMNFMREAMPFDKIRVLLYVQRVSECGAVFNFEFFREQSEHSREKLHTGQQEVIWAQRQPDGSPIATPWPQSIQKALMQKQALGSIEYAVSH